MKRTAGFCVEGRWVAGMGDNDGKIKVAHGHVCPSDKGDNSMR